MAENIEMIRPINLPEAQQLSENDVFILDSETGGVRKIPKNKVYTPVDDTLSESGEAADAKVTGEKIDELKAETALIQNPVGNKSGELVSFSDGADMPAKSVIVNIEPQQSGTGTPSPDNVRPISGWESVNVNVTSVNAWDEEWELGSYNSETGAKVNNTTRIRTTNKIPCKGGTTYYFKVGVNSTYGTMCYYDASETFIGSYSFTGNATFTPPTNACWVAWTILNYGTTYNNDISINYPSNDHEYHAYNGHTTTTVNLGRTVYGGTLDVVSGVLTVTHWYRDLGDLSWSYNSGNNRFDATAIGGIKSVSPSVVSTIICSCYETVSFQSLYSGADKTIAQDNTSIRIKNTDYTDAATFKTSVTGQTLVYELATPTTYQLTPTEVKTLLGENNVWADSGDVEITYRKDINIVIDELTNAIVSLGSNL